MYYDYQSLKSDFDGMAKTIGKSVFGRDLEIIEFGRGGILFHGGIHAREHITALLVSRMAKINSEYRILKNACFFPLVNPDGVELSINGIDSVPRKYRDVCLTANGGNADFENWKANGRAVDLNLNFDADWGKGKGNIRHIAPSGYIGEKPLSEPESRALVELTEIKKYKMTFSFHSKGEELYFGYGGIDYDPVLTAKVSETLGYQAKTTLGSAGGFKDWCVLEKKIPAYTVEFGKEEYDYREQYIDQENLLEKCVDLMRLLSEYE